MVFTSTAHATKVVEVQLDQILTEPLSVSLVDERGNLHELDVR